MQKVFRVESVVSQSVENPSLNLLAGSAGTDEPAQKQVGKFANRKFRPDQRDEYELKLGRVWLGQDEIQSVGRGSRWRSIGPEQVY
jgi:hypothetical protein